MKWPTWDQAAVVAVLCVVIALVLRRMRPTRARLATLAGATELAILAALYSVWRMARVWPLDRPEGAIDRGRQINDLQRRHLMDSNEVLAYLLTIPGLPQLMEGWNEAHLGQMRLTSVGIAIAHANIRRRTGVEFDLGIWIK